VCDLKPLIKSRLLSSQVSALGHLSEHSCPKAHKETLRTPVSAATSPHNKTHRASRDGGGANQRQVCLISKQKYLQKKYLLN